MQRLPQAYYQNPEYKTKTQLRAAAHKERIRVTSTTIDDALSSKQVNEVSKAVQTVDAEKDASMVDRLNITWLPHAAKVYHISPRVEDYILVSTIICPSDIPNRNGIAFPTGELARFQPPPMNRMVYEAWAKCPVHYEHDNEDHTKAYGVIFDSTFHKVQGYGGGKLWKVQGLLGIDKQKYPDMARRVLEGEVNTYSMGALVDYFQCGFCGTECSSTHVCPHISSIKNVNWSVQQSYDGQKHLAFLNAFGISPIECSIVEDPAWAPALSDTVFEVDDSIRPWDQNKQEPNVKRALQEHPSSSHTSIFDSFPTKW
jgi:hypothetical protein